jgi:hypothetical protein
MVGFARAIRVACVGALLGVLGGCGSSPAGPEALSIRISPSIRTLELGGSVQLTATVMDSRGAFVSANVLWHTSSPEVAEVSRTGMVKSMSEGVVTISASVRSVMGHSSLIVQDSRPRRTLLPPGIQPPQHRGLNRGGP